MNMLKQNYPKLFEATKNHLGETRYSTYKSWKEACRKADPDCWFEGDMDIAQCFVGPKPFVRGKTFSIGEWEGDVGSIFKRPGAKPGSKKVVEAKNETEADEKERLKRLADGFEKMSPQRKAMMMKIPGWKDQMELALKSVGKKLEEQKLTAKDAEERGHDWEVSFTHCPDKSDKKKYSIHSVKALSSSQAVAAAKAKLPADVRDCAEVESVKMTKKVEESADYAKQLVRGEKSGPGLLNKLDRWLMQMMFIKNGNRFLPAHTALDQLRRAGFSEDQITIIRDAATHAGNTAIKVIQQKHGKEAVPDKYLSTLPSSFQVFDLFLNVDAKIRDEFAELMRKLFDAKIDKMRDKLEIVKMTKKVEESADYAKQLVRGEKSGPGLLNKLDRWLMQMMFIKNGNRFLPAHTALDQLRRAGFSEDQITIIRDAATHAGHTAIKTMQQKHGKRKVPDKYLSTLPSSFQVFDLFLNVDAKIHDEFAALMRKLFDAKIDKMKDKLEIVKEDSNLQSLGKTLKTGIAGSKPTSEPAEPEESKQPVFKVGDKVKPLAGPHQDVVHTVVKIHSNGTIDIKPDGLEGEANEYKNGGANAKPEQLVAEGIKLKGLFSKGSLLIDVESQLNEGKPKLSYRPAKGHTIEAYGVKGMKSTRWRKTFKNSDEMADWCERNDAKVEGQRNLAESADLNGTKLYKKIIAALPEVDRARFEKFVDRLYNKTSPEPLTDSEIDDEMLMWAKKQKLNLAESAILMTERSDESFRFIRRR